MIERMLADCEVAHGPRSMVLRYFNAAGADPEGEIGEDHLPETHLLPLAIAAAQGRGPAVAGRPVPVREAPRRAGDPPVLVADPARAMARLGWRPVYAGLEEMVATAWRWHAVVDDG